MLRYFEELLKLYSCASDLVIGSTVFCINIYHSNQSMQQLIII